MSDINEQNKKSRESWKLWDAVFSGGLFSFFKDCEEAESDDKKFKQLLSQILFSIVFTVILFGIVFLLVT
jgi:hypothetical protein